MIQKYKTNGNLEGVWWGVLYSVISYSLVKLKSIVQGTRNWRPIILSIAFPTAERQWKDIEKLTGQIASYSAFVNMYLIDDAKNFIIEENMVGSFMPLQCQGAVTESLQILVKTSQQAGLPSNTL
ncbi:MAG: hypothetical protein PF447_01180, partial [Spirochaetaceae bacterium]|nr:hypothetical protein [Spirochaetaceae bacterium]